MNYIFESLLGAFKIIINIDREFISIIKISLKVSSISTLIASGFGVPLGFIIGIIKFRGRNVIKIFFNTLMALPTVVVGLFVYSLISKSSPLGAFELLFTQSAMVIGQTILVFPIAVALSTGMVENHGEAAYQHALLLGSSRRNALATYLFESRLALFTIIITVFSRVFSEVGVSMMLGGNIRFYTRNITTAIALETSKGNFSLALALGMILLTIALSLNLLLFYFKRGIR